MADTPAPRARKDRITRQHKGTRAAPKAKVLPPETILSDDPPPVAADADDSLPADLEFAPVPRRPRSNGLTPKRQRLFIKYLALTGSVSAACRAIGCSGYAVYHLKHSPGAEGFAAAWERAVERGARRVRDVLVEQAIEGIPERIYKDGELIAERRVFNTRAQMWIVAHHMPEKFGVSGGLMHAASGPLNVKRLRDQWRREQAEAAGQNRQELRERIGGMIGTVRRFFKQNIADDPAKRAAWELLAGPTDWSDLDTLPDYGRTPGTVNYNVNRPDVILTMAMPLNDDGKTLADRMMGVDVTEEGVA